KTPFFIIEPRAQPNGRRATVRLKNELDRVAAESTLPPGKFVPEPERAYRRTNRNKEPCGSSHRAEKAETLSSWVWWASSFFKQDLDWQPKPGGLSTAIPSTAAGLVFCNPGSRRRLKPPLASSC